MDIAKFLDAICIAWHPTGSRYICSPPVLDTDDDYVCLVSSDATLEDYGFTKTSTESDEYDGVSDFVTWRRGEINLICTSSENFFGLFVAATEMARRRNLIEKSERIKLFQRVLYGV